MDENANIPQQSDEEKPASIPVTIEKVLEVLQNGVVDAEHGAIQWSSNYTFLVSVKQDDMSVMAVYKPQRGERPLWDFPDGSLCQRERAAYITSQAMNWQIVPPTVLRDGPRGIGSMQFFIDHDPDYHYFHFDESLIPQLKRMALFDVLVNNADRKGGHCIVDEQNHLWGIDHGITFHAQYKLRTVIWNFVNQRIADDLLADVQKLRDKLENPNDPYLCEMETLITKGELRSFIRRIDTILTNKFYPAPGPGPNHPWPPV
ncbi:MAG: SCO1664 family protein [Anaerolineae bacterium]|nr:SCO1664 family protein [Anaerolineae bacterium]